MKYSIKSERERERRQTYNGLKKEKKYLMFLFSLHNKSKRKAFNNQKNDNK